MPTAVPPVTRTKQIIIKYTTTDMEVNLISTFAEFKELKNIDRPTMMSVLENIFRTQLEKMYGSATILTSSSISTRVTSRYGGTARWWRRSRTPTPRYPSRRYTR